LAYIKNADKLKILILEDMVNRLAFFKEKLGKHDVYYFDQANDATEALRLINDKPWDIVFLDHDLEGRIFVPSSYHNTGYTVAKFIADNPDIEIGQVIIHSMNPIGSKNMKTVLPRADVIPYNLLRKKL